MGTKKSTSIRIDTRVDEKFNDYLKALKEVTGDYIAKENVIEFFMDYCVELKPKTFLQMFYAYKAKKFSEGRE